MRRANKTEFSPPTIGSVSLLVVFAVLCLTVFALLSLTTVRSNERMSIASAQAVLDYYAADSEAERILAEIRNGSVPDGVTTDGYIFTYDCPISQTQTLRSEVRYDGNDYIVDRRTSYVSGRKETDSSMNLWDGSDFEDQ